MKHDELVSPEPPRRWTEQDGAISFQVTSDGLTGEAWIVHLESKGLRVGPYGKSALRSKDFVPTIGVTTQVRVLRGELWVEDQRSTRNIRAEADRRKFVKPNAEVACLIRDILSDADIEDMGLTWIVAMHDPIENLDGDLCLLAADRDYDGRWLDACNVHIIYTWDRYSGFAFAVASQAT